MENKDSGLKNLISFKHIKNDLPAGLILFLVALPLCLGIALASGSSLFSGLISGIVAGIVVSFFSGSEISVSGPAAGLTIIVATSINELNSFPGFLVAVVLCGVLQILLAVIRAGTISNYFPASVIKGMLAAIGLILIVKQVPHAFGYDSDYEGDFEFFQVDKENSLSEILTAANKTHPGAIIISLISLGILLLWENTKLKNNKIVKGPLVVVVVGIFINKWFNTFDNALELRDNHVVNIPVADSLWELSTFFTTPDWKYLSRWKVWEVAFTLAIAATLQSLLTVDALEKLDPKKRISNPNKELMAQGIGNMVSGLIGGLPLIAEIVRSSVNLSSGSETRLATIIHGVLILLAVILIPNIINHIPLSSLAAILIMVGFRLIKPEIIKSVYKSGWNQFFPFVITILAIFFTNLLKGISLGIVVGIIFIIKRELEKGLFIQEEEGRGSKLKVYMLAEEVSFLSKARLLKELKSNLNKHTTIIIDGTRSVYIDYDVLEALNHFKSNAESNNIKVELINIKDKY